DAAAHQGRARRGGVGADVYERRYGGGVRARRDPVSRCDRLEHQGLLRRAGVIRPDQMRELRHTLRRDFVEQHVLLALERPLQAPRILEEDERMTLRVEEQHAAAIA